jgi:hypothetical protein
MAEHVAVELATVPANGVQAIDWSAPFSGVSASFTTVPIGMFDAAIATVTATALLIVTSGTKRSPVGFGGVAIPLTLVTRTEGTPAGFSGGR